MLIIGLACVQRCAGALERVCLSFRWFCVQGLGFKVLIWLACVQCCAGALERVCLSFGWRVRSAVRVHLSGCAYHLAGVCAALHGCT